MRRRTLDLMSRIFFDANECRIAVKMTNYLGDEVIRVFRWT